MTSTGTRIRDAFDYLLRRGYSLAAESDAGMAGTIAYRSALLWLSFEWDRSDPWLTFTFVRVGPEPVLWTDVDQALTKNSHPEYGPSALPEAPIPTLVAFLGATLEALEQELESPASVEFHAAIRRLESSRRRELAVIRAARRFR